MQNTPSSLTVAYVSPGFELGSTRASMNAMTAYALHLLSNLYTVAPPSWTFTILTTHKRIPTGQARPPSIETLSSPPIRVERCFRGNSFGFLRLWLTIRRHRFDLVHIQHETHAYGSALSVLLFPFFIACTRLITTPVVTLHHVIKPDQVDAAFAHMHHTRIPPMFIRWGYLFFYRLLGLFAPSIIVHNALFKETLIRKYGIPEEHITVIPHGVQDPTISTASRCQKDLRKHFHIPEDADTIFGFFGYFTGYKGIDFLIEEFGEHIRKFPKSVLLIGGLPAEAHAGKKMYQSFVNNLKHSAETRAPGRVIWHGAVRDDEVWQYFRLVDCLVLPYRLCFASSGPLSYAIGSSKPFLASEALRPLVPYEHLLFALQKGALTAKLDAFSSLSPDEKKKMAESLHPFRNQHRWATVARMTAETYERSLEAVASHTDLLLVGAYGQGNLGDELLLETCLQRLPRNACTVASADPVATEHAHSVRAVPSHASIGLFRSFLAAQTIVVGGGDQFKLLKKSMQRSAHSLLLRSFLIVTASRLLGKKVYFVGVGIGTLTTRWARLLCGLILRMTDTVTFRDRESAQTARLLAPRARIIESADLAFLQGRHIRQHANVTQPVQHLGIAPVFHLDHAEAFPSVARALSAATDQFLQEDSARDALFLPFQTGTQPHQDIVTSHAILDSMALRDRCRIAYDLGLDTVERTYGGLDVLWGMRLHSLILACLFRVPFIALIYDVKVRKFLEAIDCVRWGIPLDASFSAEKLLALHRTLLSEREHVRAHLHAQTEKLTQLAERNAVLFHAITTEITGADRRTLTAEDHGRFRPLASES